MKLCCFVQLRSLAKRPFLPTQHGLPTLPKGVAAPSAASHVQVVSRVRTSPTVERFPALDLGPLLLRLPGEAKSYIYAKCVCWPGNYIYIYVWCWTTVGPRVIMV